MTPPNSKLAHSKLAYSKLAPSKLILMTEPNHDSPMTSDRIANATRPIQALATDLDGTLIPLSDSQHTMNPQHRADLVRLQEILQRHQLPLIYVTGRHLASVRQAMEQYQLPQPDWICCDVGTTIYSLQKSGDYAVAADYAQSLSSIAGHTCQQRLRQIAACQAELKLQEAEKQGAFKLSFYTDAAAMPDTVRKLEHQLSQQNLPFVVIHSVDPFTADGLIDVLPAGVSKAFALQWWCQRHAAKPDQVLFAGDSGNDTAAFNAGFLAILVANTPSAIARDVRNWHQLQRWQNRFFQASGTATSGVLQGLQHYLRLQPRE